MWSVWLWLLASPVIILELVWLWEEEYLPAYIRMPLALFLGVCYVVVALDLRHQARCPYCRSAREAVQALHPDWRVWTTLTHSHRASEPDREVVAIFYQQPNIVTEPPPYVLVAVSRDCFHCEMLTEDSESRYHIHGRK